MKLRSGLEAAAGVLVGAMALSMLWTHFHPSSAPTAQFAPAPPIPAAAQIHVVTVPGPPQIVTIEKQTVVHDLKLPDEIAKDPDKQVTATAQVNAGDGNKVDAISVIDTKTGQSTIETKEDRPWFSFLNEKEIGARAGVTLKGAQGVMYGRWTFARTGNVHYAVYGEGTSPPMLMQNGTPIIDRNTTLQGDAKFMLDIFYRW